MQPTVSFIPWIQLVSFTTHHQDLLMATGFHSSLLYHGLFMYVRVSVRVSKCDRFRML